MIALLLRMIFITITMISNLISHAIFWFIAEFIVLLLHTCRVPGEATKGVLEQVGEVIRSVLTFCMELVMEIIKSIISTVFELVKDGIVKAVSSASRSLMDLVEKTRESLEGAVSDIPEVMEGLVEMVNTMATDLWKNYMDVVGYVWENLA